MEGTTSGMGRGQKKKKRQKTFSIQPCDSTPSQTASFQLWYINRSLRKS